MINATELQTQPNQLTNYDVVAGAERILADHNLEQELGATAVNASMDMIDPMMQQHMDALAAMNQNFTTLSADDKPEGYTQEQMNALMKPSLTMTTLSADPPDAESARQMVAIRAQEAHDRRVFDLLEQEEKKEKADA